MKGIIRKSGAFVLCAALILTLCSCDWLDDKKAGHAVWKTGKHETILFDDTEYRLLERAIRLPLCRVRMSGNTTVKIM